MEDTSNYVEMQRVQDIFKSLMKELIVSQPQDPIKHLIEHLGSILTEGKSVQ